MNFLVWAWDYGTDSGGGIALHRLAHNLASQGHQAVLACRRTADGWLGNPQPRVTMATKEQIVIYPEVVEANPLRGARVVRWLLNTPGVFGPGNGDGVYGPRDLVMYWDRSFLPRRVKPAPWRIGGELQAWRPLDHFRDLGGERHWTCYAVRKGRGKTLDQHLEGAICIDEYATRGGDDYLIRMFNCCTAFVCYDTNTLLPTLANLCGVPNIRIVGSEAKPLTRDQVLAATAESVRQTHEFVRLCEEQWQP